MSENEGGGEVQKNDNDFSVFCAPPSSQGFPLLFFFVFVWAKIRILGRELPALTEAAREGVDEDVFIYCRLPAGCLPLCVYTQLVMAEKRMSSPGDLARGIADGRRSCCNFVLLGPRNEQGGEFEGEMQVFPRVR